MAPSGRWMPPTQRQCPADCRNVQAETDAAEMAISRLERDGIRHRRRFAAHALSALPHRPRPPEHSPEGRK